MLPRSASQLLRLLVTVPPYAVGVGFTALSVLVPTVLYTLAVARFLFVAIGIALLVAGVSFGRIVAVILLAGAVVGVGLWLLRVRSALYHGFRTEPAAMVARTRTPETDTERRVESVVERLCQTVDRPAPAVRIRDAEQPLCYTVRYPVETPPLELLERDRATYRAVSDAIQYGSAAYDATDPIPDARVLVVSTGLVSTLSERESTAVLAHEVAHLRNRDLALMNWLLVPVFWGADLAGPRRGLVSTLVGVVTVGVTMAGVAAFTRGREFAADAAAAEMTGDPAALASALERLSDADATPDADLRSVAVLNVLPPASERERLFWGLGHPSTETRVDRLRSTVAASERNRRT